jgi:predicted AlkP superfamily phosphohydrolase/phosphomutase
MKVLVIGLSGAEPELLFGDERLENVRRLMEFGCYGRLEGVASSEPALVWWCWASSRDPDSLRVSTAGFKDPMTVQPVAIWNQVEKQGKRVLVVGMPPDFSYPREVKEELAAILQDEATGEPGADTSLNASLQHKVLAQSGRQFDLIRRLMQAGGWDYLQFIDAGLERLQQATLSSAGEIDQQLIRDYYLYLDEQVGMMLEFVDEETIVSVVAAHGPDVAEGCFVLAGANNPLQGELEGTHLLDIAPTLLELAGYDVPTSMQGRSLVAGHVPGAEADTGLSDEEEEILRERLSGLGYV